MTCGAMIGAFWIFALKHQQCLFLFYINCLIIIVQARELVQLVEGFVDNAHDLGSSPRSSLFLYYFAIHIPMQFQDWSAPYTSKSGLPRPSWRSNQRPRIKAHGRMQSTLLHASGEVQQGQQFNWAFTSYLGSEPPRFAYFFTFFTFFYYLYFSLLLFY